MEHNNYREEYYPAITTYTGGGLGSLGMHNAGFFSLFSCDFFKMARETYRANNPHSPIFDIDMAEATAEMLHSYSGIPKDQIFIYLTSAPCQGISQAGVQDIFDERNLLLLNEPYIISQLLPAVFIIENVSAILNNNMAFISNTLMDEINEWLLPFYDVDYMVLNAASFGVPQSRKRFIVIGRRKDLNLGPIIPKIGNEPLRVIKDIFPLADGIVYGYNDKKFRDASQVGPTMTSTPNLKKTVGGIVEKFTIEESCRYMGLPEEWIPVGSLAQVWKINGNGITPPMSEAIFTAIYDALEKAGIPKMKIGDILEITSKTVPLSIEMERKKGKSKS